MRVKEFFSRPARFAGRIGFFGRWSRGALIIGLMPGVSFAAVDPADFTLVGVRSVLAAPAEAASPARIYAILSIQQISAVQKIDPPVDASELLRQIHQALVNQGFQLVKPRQPPEIVLKVEYGRDWLINPYLRETSGLSQVTDAASATVVDGGTQALNKVPIQTISGASDLMRKVGTGKEARTQRAGYEKLYLRITAWRYQADPRARLKPLWSTTMVVDDPDHADLNVLATSMLAAGSPYFARAIDEPELEFPLPVPEGQVKLGMPRVVDAAASKTTGKLPPPISTHVESTEPGKNFDLPAGEALTTLREFARQAGAEIIYSTAQVSGVKTPALRATLLPHAALDRLLNGTGLIAIPDAPSGAFVIRQGAK